ncbi:MAG TPA: hypothetical protein VE965_10500, partial [Gammaproteobacteria bacterium]|nr:hypothetical protein [Gammaproteobacteria bacterium]
ISLALQKIPYPQATATEDLPPLRIPLSDRDQHAQPEFSASLCCENKEADLAHDSSAHKRRHKDDPPEESLR